jgi:hypothetical protein
MRTAQAQQPQQPPEPEFDPQVLALRRRAQALISQAQQQGTLGAIAKVPGAEGSAARLVDQAKIYETMADERVKRLDEERQRILQTGEEKVRGEQAAKIEIGKKEEQDQLKFLQDAAEEGVDAKSHIGQLDAIAELGEKAPYGGLAQLRQTLGKYGVPTQGLTDIQAYQAAIDFFAPQLRPPGSGRLMSNEMAGFKSALGGLLTTPEGRRIAVDNLKLMSQYKMKVGEVARDRSLTPSERMDRISGIQFPTLRTSVPGMEDRGAGKPITQEEWSKLRSGERYLAPDGQWRIKR